MCWLAAASVTTAQKRLQMTCLRSQKRADGTRRGSLASPDFLLRTEVAFAPGAAGPAGMRPSRNSCGIGGDDGASLEAARSAKWIKTRRRLATWRRLVQMARKVNVCLLSAAEDAFFPRRLGARQSSPPVPRELMMSQVTSTPSASANASRLYGFRSRWNSPSFIRAAAST